MAQAKATTDRNTIRKWIESRGGKPSRVKGTEHSAKHHDEGGVLRIDFAEPDESLEPISWEEFFQIFDERDLALLYQDEGHGSKSYFAKFVRRDSASKH